MELDTELAAFVTSPVMIIIGTRDRDNRPEVGRGVGAKVTAGGAVEIVVSGWQWAGTVDNLRNGSAAAVTFARPSDYVTYQLKGPAALRSADTADLTLAEGYLAAIRTTLEGLGLPPAVVAQWCTSRDAAVIRIAVADLFEQTPGPRAGRRLEGNR